VQLFTVIFQQPIPFGVAALVASFMVILIAKSVMTSEDRAKRGWVRALTNANGKIFFGLLFVLWAVVLGGTLQLVPQEGASSPYGAIALIGMFAGIFIMMGFLWAVIGE
jgi:hypothetical protein